MSSWIEHVKDYARMHNLPYNKALSRAKSSYKSGGRLVKTDADRDLFNQLYQAGTPTIYIPPEMAYINKYGKQEIINTLTSKKNITSRNKEKVIKIKANDMNEFRIENGRLYDSSNNEIKVEDIKEMTVVPEQQAPQPVFVSEPPKSATKPQNEIKELRKEANYLLYQKSRKIDGRSMNKYSRIASTARDKNKLIELIKELNKL